MVTLVIANQPRTCRLTIFRMISWEFLMCPPTMGLLPLFPGCYVSSVCFGYFLPCSSVCFQHFLLYDVVCISLRKHLNICFSKPGKYEQYDYVMITHVNVRTAVTAMVTFGTRHWTALIQPLRRKFKSPLTESLHRNFNLSTPLRNPWTVTWRLKRAMRSALLQWLPKLDFLGRNPSQQSYLSIQHGYISYRHIVKDIIQFRVQKNLRA